MDAHNFFHSNTYLNHLNSKGLYFMLFKAKPQYLKALPQMERVLNLTSSNDLSKNRRNSVGA